MPNRLDIEYRVDFVVLGMVSACAEHRLAWSINRALQIELSKCEDLVLEFRKTVAMISHFFYGTAHDSFRLIRNRSYLDGPNTRVQRYLLKELRHFDYLLVIDNQTGTLMPEEIEERLRTLAEIQLIRLVEVDRLKEKENLLF